MEHPENRFTGEPADADLILRTADHPEANGRKPQFGDMMYTMQFKLEDGLILRIECGTETYDEFSGMMKQMEIDDAFDRLVGNIQTENTNDGNERK